MWDGSCRIVTICISWIDKRNIVGGGLLFWSRCWMLPRRSFLFFKPPCVGFENFSCIVFVGTSWKYFLKNEVVQSPRIQCRNELCQLWAKTLIWAESQKRWSVSCAACRLVQALLQWWCSGLKAVDRGHIPAGFHCLCRWDYSTWPSVWPSVVCVQRSQWFIHSVGGQDGNMPTVCQPQSEAAVCWN